MTFSVSPFLCGVNREQRSQRGYLPSLPDNSPHRQLRNALISLSIVGRTLMLAIKMEHTVTKRVVFLFKEGSTLLFHIDGTVLLFETFQWNAVLGNGWM